MCPPICRKTGLVVRSRRACEIGQSNSDARGQYGEKNVPAESACAPEERTRIVRHAGQERAWLAAGSSTCFLQDTPDRGGPTTTGTRRTCMDHTRRARRWIVTRRIARDVTAQESYRTLSGVVWKDFFPNPARGKSGGRPEMAVAAALRSCQRAPVPTRTPVRTPSKYRPTPDGSRLRPTGSGPRGMFHLNKYI